MSVLLLRLAGPLQAWGSGARFARRTTEHAPTKSGVLGMLAAAEGRERDADLSDLVALRYGVRIDQPGTRVRDFQTAHHADTDKAMPLSERFYLADAVFVAAVEGGAGLIDRLCAAVREPVWLPYLGRRSCPPSAPLDLGVRGDADLVTALGQVPWQASDWYRSRFGVPSELPLLLDCPPGESPDQSLRDVPVTFDPRHRRYGLRGVVARTAPNPADPRLVREHPTPDGAPALHRASALTVAPASTVASALDGASALTGAPAPTGAERPAAAPAPRPGGRPPLPPPDHDPTSALGAV